MNSEVVDLQEKEEQTQENTGATTQQPSVQPAKPPKRPYTITEKVKKQHEKRKEGLQKHHEENRILRELLLKAKHSSEPDTTSDGASEERTVPTPVEAPTHQRDRFEAKSEDKLEVLHKKIEDIHETLRSLSTLRRSSSSRKHKERRRGSYCSSNSESDSSKESDSSESDYRRWKNHKRRKQVEQPPSAPTPSIHQLLQPSFRFL